MTSSSSPSRSTTRPSTARQMFGVYGLAGGVQVPFSQHAAELSDGGLVRLAVDGPLYPA